MKKILATVLILSMALSMGALAVETEDYTYESSWGESMEVPAVAEYGYMDVTYAWEYEGETSESLVFLIDTEALDGTYDEIGFLFGWSDELGYFMVEDAVVGSLADISADGTWILYIDTTEDGQPVFVSAIENPYLVAAAIEEEVAEEVTEEEVVEEEVAEEVVEEEVVEEEVVEEEVVEEEVVEEVFVSVTGDAVATFSAITVNAESVEFEAYFIDGNNYFKLRDLAAVFSGTEATFDVAWDGDLEVIALTSGEEYTAVGGELEPASGEDQIYQTTPVVITVDGEVVELEAYNINGNNYFMLRSICAIFDVGVEYNEETRAIDLDTSVSYVPEAYELVD